MPSSPIAARQFSASRETPGRGRVRTETAWRIRWCRLLAIALVLLCVFSGTAESGGGPAEPVLCVRRGITANLRARASREAPVLETVKGDTKVEVIGPGEPWVRVRTPARGATGWMHSSLLVACRDGAATAGAAQREGHGRRAGPVWLFSPIELDAIRPVVGALAPIFYLLGTTVILSLVADALGFTFGQHARVTIPLVLMSFLMTPRELIDLVFVMYSWMAAVAVTAINGVFLGRRSQDDSPALSWILGVGGPVLALLFVALGRMPEVYLVALLFSWAAVFTNVKDVLGWIAEVNPRLATWGPMVTLALLLFVFSEFYLALAWRPWPLVQFGVGVSCFALGARADG